MRNIKVVVVLQISFMVIFIASVGNVLQEVMATHSSIFARIIPWTEESGRLQSMGSQRAKNYMQ
jgi:hypothetical protein